jgi:cytochrome c-type biogenesis protein CcsB
MFEKISNILVSSRTMAVLLLVFAVSIAIATFVENSYDTITAKRLIYNASWFYGVIGLLALNFLANIKRYRLWRWEKWSILCIHLGLILTIIGAGVTHFFGFEGIVPIEEGETVRHMYTSETYFQCYAHDTERNKRWSLVFKYEPSALLSNDFSHEFDFPEIGKLRVNYVKHLPRIKKGGITPNLPGGKDYVEVVLENMQSEYIASGEYISRNGQFITFNYPIEGAINILGSADSLELIYTSPILRLSMESQQTDTLWGGVNALKKRHLHMINGVNLVFKDFHPSAKFSLEEDENSSQEVLITQITVNNQSEEVELWGGQKVLPTPKVFDLGGLSFQLMYGRMAKELPFSIRLDDFILETYPGSNSPSGYKSMITLIDQEAGVNRQDSVFMNNVLDYKGYRVFQSSYDLSGGVETSVFSINNDFWGTWISYFAYFILSVGFIFTLFNSSSRFVELRNKAKKIRSKRKSTLTIFLFLFGLTAFSAENYRPIPNSHMEKFDRLLVMSYSGRIQPIQSLAIDVLHKLSRTDDWKVGSHKLTPSQVFLGMFCDPRFWLDQPLLKFDARTGVGKELGVEGSFCAITDIITIDEEGMMVGDKIIALVEAANAKPMGDRNTFDKEAIKLNEKLNIALNVIRGQYMKIIPISYQGKLEWVDWTSPLAEAPIVEGHDEMQSFTTNRLIYTYLENLIQGSETGDFSAADEMAVIIHGLQRNGLAKDVIPSESMIELELIYNQLNLFNRLKLLYAVLAFVLLILTLIENLSSTHKKGLKWMINSLFILLFIGFILHTSNLAMRWYIVGHAPWSDGYEALTFIAWAGLLAGFIFVKHSRITLAATALLAFFILLTAGHSQYDPQLSQLEPVLKSYWLVIHVACLTISYGFFGLGFILSLINMGIFAFRSAKNLKQSNLTIKELTFINEMTLTIGLALATIGTFLGGVWANESWGRYWGWDAKETWALVIVLVYAFVLHMRFVPGLRSEFALNMASLLSFSTVLFTFIGVNFYLTKGLHSYARGDAPAFAWWVWLILFSIFALIGIAYWRNKKIQLTEK